MKLTNVKSICLAPRRLIFFFSVEHAISFKMYISVSLGPVKLRGDFSDNRLVRCASPFLISFVFSDRNDRRVVRMTRQLERPESQNYRKR
jgi:hypothetical protein